MIGSLQHGIKWSYGLDQGLKNKPNMISVRWREGKQTAEEAQKTKSKLIMIVLGTFLALATLGLAVFFLWPKTGEAPKPSSLVSSETEKSSKPSAPLPVGPVAAISSSSGSQVLEQAADTRKRTLIIAAIVAAVVVVLVSVALAACCCCLQTDSENIPDPETVVAVEEELEEEPVCFNYLWLLVPIGLVAIIIGGSFALRKKTVVDGDKNEKDAPAVVDESERDLVGSVGVDKNGNPTVAISTPKGVQHFTIIERTTTRSSIVKAYEARMEGKASNPNLVLIEGIIKKKTPGTNILFPFRHVYTIYDKTENYDSAFQPEEGRGRHHVSEEAEKMDELVHVPSGDSGLRAKYCQFIVENFEKFDDALENIYDWREAGRSRLLMLRDKELYNKDSMAVHWLFDDKGILDGKQCGPTHPVKISECANYEGQNMCEHLRHEFEEMVEEFKGLSPKQVNKN